ncbi:MULTISPECIES: uracil-DNA glycosylase [Haloferacaceae]|uniref:Type-4 uracil-DNA glycosylase n=1 Tax=Halorubrum glutamatedens TaxID=2707018 RepID=A0ABD5QML9_9EURY|nr:uracil-DNA glycosylase [Halobellus captivus]
MSEDGDGNVAGGGVDADGTLDADLRVGTCQRCPALVESRSRIVEGVGPTDADLLLVGEGPGANEDERGEPFVGRSGDVLDGALRDAGLARADVRITNCVRCRPPENRDPTTEELANCHGHLEAEIAGLDPELIVTLGKVPSEHLLDRSVGITSESGDVVDARIGGASRRVLLSVHPAATLYDRSQREGFFETIARAGALSGVVAGGGDGSGGQSRLGEF